MNLEEYLRDYLSQECMIKERCTVKHQVNADTCSFSGIIKKFTIITLEPCVIEQVQ